MLVSSKRPPSSSIEKETAVPKTQLQTSKLGATGLEIARLGFGAWAIGGGGWEFGWGSQDDEESVAAIQRERLGVDAIDLYQIHWPIPEEDIEQGWAALAELKEQGLVRHIGVSNVDVAQLRRIQQIAPVETCSRSTPSSPARPRTRSCPSPNASGSA
jgi:aryl-alcohol dehydrogenase-like predicted oxidoreductase